MQTLDIPKLKDELKSLKTKYGDNRSSLIPMLQDLQRNYRYLSGTIIQETAHSLGIHPVEVEGVVSFYSFFKREQQQGKFIIRLCQTISCNMVGKERLAKQFENELNIKFGETTKDNLFTLEYTSCLGMCDQGPAILINDQLFAKVTPDMVPEIIDHCKKGFIKGNLPIIEMSDTQKKGPILQHSLTPGDSITKAEKMDPQDIINEIKESKLLGRGGAGFPTALKWQFAHDEKSSEKYVVCNADEGEPGTFKDRYLIHDQTDLLLEGIAIAARAIGAKKGFIYLRGEYGYLKLFLQERLDSFLTKFKNIDLNIEIRMGGGAYICGEETALIQSLEGFRGEPRNRPPYPVDTGFHGKPTSVNNVETFIATALIISKGADWFKSNGTDKSTGTKIFSVSGDCEKPGIYELPFGLTISEFLKEVGGEDAKGIQVGGAAGICISKEEFNRTIGYEDVSTGGSIIVFGQERDMLEVAINFMEFFAEESCGQCTPCREGNVKILDGLYKLKNGKCSTSYLRELVKLGETMQIASKCGLGQSSPNAFLSIVKNYKHEILGRMAESN